MKYGPDAVEAAQRSFEALGEGADLYTLLFSLRLWEKYHYYARGETLDLKYMATIYGHYWVVNVAGKRRGRFCASTLHYMEYAVGMAVATLMAGSYSWGVFFGGV